MVRRRTDLEWFLISTRTNTRAHAKRGISCARVHSVRFLAEISQRLSEIGVHGKHFMEPKKVKAMNDFKNSFLTDKKGQDIVEKPSRIMTETHLTAEKSLWYGWLRFRPRWLQFLNTPRWFLFFMSFYLFIVAFILNGLFPGVASTIEKRFAFSR